MKKRVSELLGKLRGYINHLFYPTLFRHVFRQFLFIFISVDILVSVFFLGLRFLNMSSALLMGVSLGDLFLLTLFFMPPFFGMLFPLSLYISTYVAVSRMRSDREIVVLEGLGYRIKELYAPFFAISLAVFLFLTLNVLVFEPVSVRMAESRISKIMKSYKLSIKGDTFVDAFKGCVMYVGENDGGVLKNILIYRREAGRETIITAPKGVVKRKGGEYILHLERGHMEVSGSLGSLDVINFKEMLVGFSPSGRLSPKKLFTLKDKELDIVTLSRMIKKAEASKDAERVSELKAMLHLKISLVISALILPLIAFSVGSGRLMGVLSGVRGLFAFLVLFYGVFALFQSYGATMAASPAITSYIPDVILLFVGVSVFRRLKE